MFWVRGRDNLRQYLRSKVRRRDLTVPKTGLKLSSSSTRIRFFYFQVSVLFCSKKEAKKQKIFLSFSKKKIVNWKIFAEICFFFYLLFCSVRFVLLGTKLSHSWASESRFLDENCRRDFFAKKINPTLVRTKVRCVWCASKKWTIFSSLSHTHSLSVR